MSSPACRAGHRLQGSRGLGLGLGLRGGEGEGRRGGRGGEGRRGGRGVGRGGEGTRAGEGRGGGSSLQEEYIQGERFQAGVTSLLQKPIRTEELQARKRLGDRGEGSAPPLPVIPDPSLPSDLVPNLSPCPVTVPFEASLIRPPCTAAPLLGPCAAA